MDLYLMQHGESKPEEEDPERPLTDAGRATVERVSSRFAGLGPRLDLVVHSGRLRAEQTAAVLASHVRPEEPARAREGLGPNDPVEPVASWLGETGAEGVAIVGHLPFLDRLASLLVADDERAQVVAFRMGGLVKLVPKDGREGFRIEWVLSPELA